MFLFVLHVLSDNISALVEMIWRTILLVELRDNYIVRGMLENQCLPSRVLSTIGRSSQFTR